MMAPTAVLASPALPRSQSSPSIPTLGSLEESRHTKLSSALKIRLSPKARRNSLLGSKILPAAPDFDIPTFNDDFKLDTSLLSSKPEKNESVITRTWETEPEDLPTKRTRRPKDGNAAPRPKTWFLSSKVLRSTSVKSLEHLPESISVNQEKQIQAQDAPPSKKPAEGPADSRANLQRRSWMLPGPPSVSIVASAQERNPATSSSSLSSTTKSIAGDERSSSASASGNLTESISRPPPPTRSLSKATSYLAKMKTKHAAAIGRLSSSNDFDLSYASSITSISKRGPGSIDTYTSHSSSWESNSPTTDESSGDMDMWNKDPLWSTFKTLEVEHKVFISKSIDLKMLQIKDVLLPFLRSSANHPSNNRLGLEDLDRRTTVMSKWWQDLLDMLNSSKSPSHYALPYSDIPSLLEALELIMIRPEWRSATSYYRPLLERSPTERVRTGQPDASSQASVNSSQADFLSESAEHNVRTTYQLNLMRQMRFVVERMALRDAGGLGLVAFAAKTCAYAFFFAPGVADILLRLWGLSHNLLRHVADAFQLPKRNRNESDDIVALFPPHLSSYGWSSPQAVWHNLTQTVRMHVQLSGVPWTGPWVSRWRGRDSDLFFLFCRNFHILSDEFIPSGLPLVEKARAPAFAIIHAQLLSILDSTIRGPQNPHLTDPPLIDAQQGSDAAALTMPLPSAGLAKGSLQNRFLSLVEDWILDSSENATLTARRTFLEAFWGLAKATALRTQQHNSVACFHLCDFLEGALMIFHKHDQLEAFTTFVDWPFWLQVCKKMLESQHTISEVRVLSFLYTIWDAVMLDPQRKQSWCFDWLLSDETFATYFSHWSPMVRAYYHRLLCWRICRDEGTVNNLDDQIFTAAAEKLKTIWSNYLFLKQEAIDRGKVPPSSAPVLPTLGKRLIIIRQEVENLPSRPFMTFDGLALSRTKDLAEDLNNSSQTLPPNGKKRWSLLGKVLSITANAQSGSMSDEDSDDEGVTTAQSPPLPHKNREAKVEERQFEFKFFLGFHYQTAPTQDRLLTRPRLPTPAQARIRCRIRGESPPPPAASRAMATRAVSGSASLGLVSEARNAETPTGENLSDSWGPPPTLPRLASTTSESLLSDLSGLAVSTTPSISSRGSVDTESEDAPLITPIEASKPKGMFAKNKVYCGRALAEWTMVVIEYNNFVDRRRSEGVLGLKEMEVPLLGVEHFRRMYG